MSLKIYSNKTLQGNWFEDQIQSESALAFDQRLHRASIRELESGLCVADQTGRVQHSCPRTRRLQTQDTSRTMSDDKKARDYTTTYGKIGSDRFGHSKPVPGDSTHRKMVGLKNLPQVKRLVGLDKSTKAHASEPSATKYASFSGAADEDKTGRGDTERSPEAERPADLASDLSASLSMPAQSGNPTLASPLTAMAPASPSVFARRNILAREQRKMATLQTVSDSEPRGRSGKLGPFSRDPDLRPGVEVFWDE